MLSKGMITRICVMIVCLVVPSTSLVYPSIQWTPRNPVFQKPEKTRIINVQSMSRINIICPNPAMNVDVVQDNTPKEWMYENLWIVSKNSYDKCNASSTKTDRLLLRCDMPLQLKYYTVRFLQYSVTTQGLEFPVGKEYYFIATSDGTKASLSNRAGGNCVRGSMKMKYYVCKGPTDPRCKPPTTSKPQSNSGNSVVGLPTTANLITKHIITTLKTTSVPKVIPSSSTPQYTTNENKGLQSDDPRMTLRPTLSSQGTERLPEVTTVAPKVDVKLFRKEECKHDHGSQPSWNVVIPLLVVIFILVIMNSVVICRLLRQGNTKSSITEDNFNNTSTRTYNLKNNNQNSSPVLV